MPVRHLRCVVAVVAVVVTSMPGGAAAGTDPSDADPATRPTPVVVAPRQAGDPGLSGIARAEGALLVTVPAGWLSVLRPPMSSRPGSTSMAYPDQPGRPRRTEIGTAHLAADWSKLRFIVAHEWAHHVAFVHGGPGLGSAPAGFPGNRSDAELWANCVAIGLTGADWTPRGQAACAPDQVRWAANFLAYTTP